MSRVTVLLICVVGLPSLWAQLPDAEALVIQKLMGYDPTREVMVFASVDEEGWETIYKMPLETMKKCPTWDGRKPIPLAIEKAIELASVETKLTCQDFDDRFQLNGIELNQIENDPFKRFEMAPWYYMIHFRERVAARNGPVTEWPEVITVCVLMDGTIVRPQKRKRNVSPMLLER
jgi:hypothetical protein